MPVGGPILDSLCWMSIYMSIYMNMLNELLKKNSYNVKYVQEPWKFHSPLPGLMPHPETFSGVPGPPCSSTDWPGECSLNQAGRFAIYLPQHPALWTGDRVWCCPLGDDRLLHVRTVLGRPTCTWCALLRICCLARTRCPWPRKALGWGRSRTSLSLSSPRASSAVPPLSYSIDLNYVGVLPLHTYFIIFIY